MTLPDSSAEPIACDLFEFAPISLWEEDYSALRAYLDDLRQQGVTDLRTYLDAHPNAVDECLGRIQVLNVNRQTLALYRADSKQALLAGLGRVFRDEMRVHFAGELVDLWEGRLTNSAEGINYALNGDALHIQLYWAVLPGSETDLARVLVSIEDITARKKAEAYLKYLGTHDVLTGLYNRTYFEEEMVRLGRSRRYPISIIIVDLDGLKPVNDSRGHAEGDRLIRRAAEVLQASVRGEDVVARGGDEFAIILPATDGEAVAQAAQRIHSLAELNNMYSQSPTLTISVGAATVSTDSALAVVLREADDRMYVEKRRHHGRR